MSAIVYRCAREVFWFAENLTTQCVRPAGHKGLHCDGLWWFTDDGIRTARPDSTIDREGSMSDTEAEPKRVTNRCADPRCGHRLDDHANWLRGGSCYERGCPCQEYQSGSGGQRGSEAGCYG